MTKKIIASGKKITVVSSEDESELSILVEAKKKEDHSCGEQWYTTPATSCDPSEKYQVGLEACRVTPEEQQISKITKTHHQVKLE